MSFKIGDAVNLKGGGPTMTITGTSTGTDRDVLYSCTWFDKDDKEQLSSYPAGALVITEKQQPRARRTT
jgi:uncharacterized protein YodC (DUF2158 family)